MPRPKPKVDWSARTELPDNPYSDDDVELIVNSVEGYGKPRLSTADRRHLLSLVRQVGQAFLLATYQHLGPTPGEIQTALRKLRKEAEKLSQTISALDDATVFALLRQRGEFRKAYLNVQWPTESTERRHVRALSIIPTLAAEAKAAIEEVGKPHPPEAENPLDWMIDWEIDPIYPSGPPVGKFIVQLAEIYYEITGEEPRCEHDRDSDKYSGDFLIFVRHCLKPLESEKRKALGRTIQDYLPKWREARDLKS